MLRIFKQADCLIGLICQLNRRVLLDALNIAEPRSTSSHELLTAANCDVLGEKVLASLVLLGDTFGVFFNHVLW